MKECPKCKKQPIFVVKDGVATVNCCDFSGEFSFNYNGNQEELASAWDEYIKQTVEKNSICSVCGKTYDKIEYKLMCEELHKHIPPYKVGDFIKIRVWHEYYDGKDWSEEKEVEIKDVCIDSFQKPVWKYVFFEGNEEFRIKAFREGKTTDFTQDDPDILGLLSTAEEMKPHYESAERLKKELKEKFGIDSSYEMKYNGNAIFSFVHTNKGEKNERMS